MLPEMHIDAIENQKVVIIDDLLAIGNSSLYEMVEEAGGEIVGIAFLIELESLQEKSITKYPVYSLVKLD